VVAGLMVFTLGSCRCRTDLNWLLCRRALQGAGAISAAVTALLADQTRDEVRAGHGAGRRQHRTDVAVSLVLPLNTRIRLRWPVRLTGDGAGRHRHSAMRVCRAVAAPEL
jgi:hypothetical protein